MITNTIEETIGVVLENTAIGEFDQYIFLFRPIRPPTGVTIISHYFLLQYIVMQAKICTAP
jgi:hypothetical protein